MDRPHRQEPELSARQEQPPTTEATAGLRRQPQALLGLAAAADSQVPLILFLVTSRYLRSMQPTGDSMDMPFHGEYFGQYGNVIEAAGQNAFVRFEDPELVFALRLGIVILRAHVEVDEILGGFIATISAISSEASQIAATAGHIVDGAEIQLNAKGFADSGGVSHFGRPRTEQELQAKGTVVLLLGPVFNCLTSTSQPGDAHSVRCTFRHDGAPPGQMPFLGEMDTPAGFARLAGMADEHCQLREMSYWQCFGERYKGIACQAWCTYGDACTFSHGPAPGTRCGGGEETDRTRWASEVGEHEAAGGQAYGPEGQLLPMATSFELKDSSVLLVDASLHTIGYFEGKCSYGDQCKYLSCMWVTRLEFGHGFPAPAAYFAPSSVFHFAAPAPIQDLSSVLKSRLLLLTGLILEFHAQKGRELQSEKLNGWQMAENGQVQLRQRLYVQPRYAAACLSGAPVTLETISHGFVAPQQAFFAPAPQQVSAGGSSAVCRHFLEGKCNYGAECKYSHAAFGPAKGVQHRAPRPSSGGAADLKTETCRHYLLGRCNMGETCRFRHDGDTSEQEMADILAELNGGATLDGFVQKDAGPCRHFLAGKCNFGDGCRFTHDARMEKGGKGSKGRSSPY
ncbi:unnamed protein product [Polarella glacialis]|uniref:C3H1-type domain-containing protein n=1 Tax=Polarella glacialis TaxID=89957 RepID=A0A813HQM1_POLGL|nr:unnamed protein product [Polarella glacialis]